jgi:hypothetical protein
LRCAKETQAKFFPAFLCADFPFDFGCGGRGAKALPFTFAFQLFAPSQTSTGKLDETSRRSIPRAIPWALWANFSSSPPWMPLLLGSPQRLGPKRLEKERTAANRWGFLARYRRAEGRRQATGDRDPQSAATLLYKRRGGLGSYKAPHFNGGCMDSPTSAEGGHVTTTMRYDRCMPREATPAKPGKPKVRSRNGLAMLTSKAWRASLAHTDPGPSPPSGRRGGPPRTQAPGEGSRPR